MDSRSPGARPPVPEGEASAASTAFRPILPAITAGSSQGLGTGTFPDRLTKHPRHQVPSACLQCRRRKVKCSGTRPACWRCATQDLECEWDTEPDTSRVVSIRRRKEELERENEDLHELLRFLQARPEEEAVEIFKRLRASGDALQVLDFVRSGDLLLRRPPGPELVGGKGAGPSNPVLNADDVDDDLPASSATIRVPARPWTTLANDGVVSELVAAFFLWDEPFLLAFVDRDAFLEDMQDASPETASYCSPLLVNAICALRSHTSRRAKAYGHVNGCDMRTRFFDEAKHLLDKENGRVSLTTAQALFIMHLSAAATGTDRAARMYLLAACDMAQRPKVLAGGSNGGGGGGKSAKEQERHLQIMSRALWGMYCFESIFAFAYLRPSFLPAPSIPRLFVDKNLLNPSERLSPAQRNALLLDATCDLSILFNETMLYNQRTRASDVGTEEDIQRRIALFDALRSWRTLVPQHLHEVDGFWPPAYYVRAFEDQVILGIFRPLRPDLQLPQDGLAGDLLVAYCERTIAGVEEYERAISLRDCSSMILLPLFHAAVTLARLLDRPKSHDVFARTSRLIRDRVDDFPLAAFLLQGLLAVAADGGTQIPHAAKQWFEGLPLDESMLRDVPISFVLPAQYESATEQDHGDGGGIQLGHLISSWSWLSVSD
ncbi:Nitrogen assimilation transcription factor nirA 5 [Colletotrichum sojae]|uniref:Nitrogen assimilation transcription factor nirA 5 n=1 Tax=Colletotrichum sojae TaxID=2175907 RepID=A0A8H6J4U4_9PEZI|nr:Nitrogen assimilation transcription factor nirA 5 [Colletotrichum sojae]